MLLLLQVTITRPYLCANHLAAPYTGPAASAAAAPSAAPAPQSSTGNAGEGYGAGQLLLGLLPVLQFCTVAPTQGGCSYPGWLSNTLPMLSGTLACIVKYCSGVMLHAAQIHFDG